MTNRKYHLSLQVLTLLASSSDGSDSFMMNYLNHPHVDKNPQILFMTTIEDIFQMKVQKNIRLLNVITPLRCKGNFVIPFENVKNLYTLWSDNEFFSIYIF